VISFKPLPRQLLKLTCKRSLRLPYKVYCGPDGDAGSSRGSCTLAWNSVLIVAYAFCRAYGQLMYPREPTRIAFPLRNGEFAEFSMRRRRLHSTQRELPMNKATKPVSSWSFDEGSLTVRHRGKTRSLGRYATHDLAAKAAALYFAKHDEEDMPAEGAPPVAAIT